MNKVYLGIDIGSESVKGVIIDDNNNIITSEYLYIEKNSIDTSKRLISILRQKISRNGYKLVSIGTTGVARKLIGAILGADVIINEIISHTVGITSLMPNVRTVVDIGGQDIKIITLKNGKVIDYNIDNLYTLDCEGGLLLEETQEKIIIDNLTDIYKNEKLIGPISVQGGWSKNENIVSCIKELVGESIYIDKMSEFLGAFGVAIIAKSDKVEFNNYFKEFEKERVLKD